MARIDLIKLASSQKTRDGVVRQKQAGGEGFSSFLAILSCLLFFFLCIFVLW